ncbi:MAG: aldo/keto reductase, partial [Gammaproteobacteria bacterium]|nr:aldo/keto reductase [Gammaproteobacteria bacterium]
RGQALPSWARDIDCANWAQLFLKFIVSHPAVTCAIPATSKVEHMIENMGALEGRMPNAAQRLAMAVHYASL